ncbi:MAG: fused MFS/spermidine synthase [Bacteroidota bacterium]
MRSKSIKFIVILLFIFSGVCGLIYEVAWSKYLSLFIGNTAYSIMIVLATFMSGLALGSYYWGKYADRSSNRLKLYGMLELAIGVYCLFYPLLIGISEKIFVAAAMGLDAASDQVVLLLLKFLLSFTTLIIPTFFMGGTLPVLTKFLTRTMREAGKGVATLYYINSMGAVIGAGLAGFFLIRLYSLDGAVAIAAVMNLLIGATALIVSRKAQGDGEPESATAEIPETTDQPSTPLAVRLAIITAAMSGFIAMVYELAWTRLLANILGSSTYSFTLMLIAFISGITLGSWIVSLIIGRIKNLTKFLGFCQLGTALAMIATLPFYERLPYYLLKLSELTSNKPENFPYFLAGEFFFCFAIMIIPTSLSGMSLPIASRIASNDIRLLGKSIGGIFSVNTIGTVIGALVAGLFLMPQFGVKLTIELGVLLNILIGIGIISSQRELPLGWRVGIASVLVLLGIGYEVKFPEWNRFILLGGVYRFLNTANYKSFDEFRSDVSEGRNILYYKEGINANVAVVESRLDTVLQKSLLINGKTDASTVGDLSTQVLLGQIPFMVLPDSGDALVIGLGSGITCGSALRHPLRSLDCVELCSEVIECNTFFNAENYNFMRDPRTGIFNDDAITYLKITSKQYDYVLSEPTNPWIAGVGNLFTTEFFALIKNHLRPGGVLLQWFHTYDMNDDMMKLILRTMSESFPTISVWKASDEDVMILGSEHPIPLDAPSLERKFATPAIAQDLARIKILDPPAFLSTQVASDTNPRALAGEGEINTEKKFLLEFRAPLLFYTHTGITMIVSIDQRWSSSGENLLLSKYAASRGLTLNNYINIAGYRYFVDVGDDYMMYKTLSRCLELSPDNLQSLIMMSRLAMKLTLIDEGVASLKKLLTMFKENNQILAGFFAMLVQSLDQDPANLTAQKVQYFMALAGTCGECGRFDEAAQIYQKVFSLYKTGNISGSNGFEEQLSVLAAKNLLLANKPDEAKPFVDNLRNINPGNEQLSILTNDLRKRKGGF